MSAKRALGEYIIRAKAWKSFFCPAVGAKEKFSSSKCSNAVWLMILLSLAKKDQAPQ
jgi:hypothetical protein